MNNFSELTLNASLNTNLARNSYVQPTPVQAKSIPPAMTGVDLVATAQTGTGKTLAFLLPILQKLLVNRTTPAFVKALVLAPTRELAVQISESFTKLAANTTVRAAVVVGGMSEGPQITQLRRGVQLVIATPGRLQDFLDRRLINLSEVDTIVLDEADRMLDMGFLPAIEKIFKVLPANRQSMFFSATMEKTVEKLIQRHSKNPVRVAIDSTARTPDQVDLHLYEVENDMRVPLLRHLLSEEQGSVLVFARTKHGTDRLAKNLATHGVKVVAMHGGRTQSQRNQALAGFRNGQYRVLVATDVAARGIHVDSVAQVINYDLPQVPDDFVHRVGRTGRAGQRGSASTFSSRSERGEIRRIERECKVVLVRREVSPEILGELAKSQPREERHHKPVAAAPPRPAASKRFGRPAGGGGGGRRRFARSR